MGMAEEFTGNDLDIQSLRVLKAIADEGSITAAAEALGHSDLSSIGRYVIASSDTMRRGAEAAGRIG